MSLSYIGTWHSTDRLIVVVSISLPIRVHHMQYFSSDVVAWIDLFDMVPIFYDSIYAADELKASRATAYPASWASNSSMDKR